MLGLATRNVARNMRRSVITGLAVAAGTLSIVCLQGFVEGYLYAASSERILGNVGAVQVHRAGYRTTSADPLRHAMARDPALERRVLAVPGVTAIAPRVRFEGMLSNGAVSNMFVATAIDPAVEYKVCPWRSREVARGTPPLDDRSPRDILVGKALAAALEAKPGSSLSMMSTGPSGSSNALDVTVRGFLPVHMPQESKRLATVPLALADDLLRLDGKVTEYALGVGDLDLADGVAARVGAVLGEGYEVEAWRAFDAPTRMLQRNFRYVLGLVKVVLFILVASGILNTMLMSVHERVREIGTMLSFGVRRRQVLRLFLTEALLIGTAGATAGIAIGTTVIARLAVVGVPLTPPGGDPMMVYPRIDTPFVLGVAAFALGGTLLSALYPAWRASRLRPVDALRAT